MRRVLVVSAVISGLMSLSMPTAWAAGPSTIRVEGIRGDMSIRTSAKADWAGLEGSADLGVGASLRTGPGSEALLNLPGDAHLRVSPGSEVTVQSLASGEMTLRLGSGRVFASVPQAGAAKLDLKISTPTGTAVSHGGEFALVASKGATSLRVLSGDARLQGAQVAYEGAASVQGTDLEVLPGVQAVAQAGDDSKAGTTTEPGGGGGAPPSGGFPIFAVLGGVGLIAIIAVLISQSSEVQSG